MRKDEGRGTGSDVFDLAEFPIAALGETATPGPGLLEFRDGEKSWQVAAHPKYGLPTAADVEVYVALLGVTQQHNPFQPIPFQRRPLLRQMGWGLDGRAYDRIDLALRRWRHTTITGVRAVHDPKTGLWREEIAFGLIDSYRLCRRTDGTEAGQADSFRWSMTVAELLSAGYQHELDVATYMQLKSPIAQAEFRYLSAKARDGKETFEQHLLTYAQQHIGLRQSYVSNIKQKLGVSHRQLIACGFLKSVEYGVMKSGPSRGEAKIIVRLARRPELEGPRRGEAPAPPCPAPDPCPGQAPLPCPTLADRLAAAGVTRSIAEQLAAELPEMAETQLAYWPHRDQAAFKNPAGALIRSIQQNWPAPLLASKKQKPGREKKAQHNAPENQATEDDATFDTWFDSLPTADRDTLTTRAQNELIGGNPTLSVYFQRCPQSLLPALRPILVRMMKEDGRELEHSERCHSQVSGGELEGGLSGNGKDA